MAIRREMHYFLSTVLQQLLGGGHHYANMNCSTCRARESQARVQAGANNKLLPRERLHKLVQDAELSRPVELLLGVVISVL